MTARKTKYGDVHDEVETLQDYGLNVRTREIFLFGHDEYVARDGDEPLGEPGVEYAMANQFIRNLRMLSALTSDTVLIHLKTCGGDWHEGMAIYDAIRSCPNKVTILNYTHARSMSSLILLAGDRRVMMPHSWFMIHKGTQGFYGTARQFKTEYHVSQMYETQMMAVYIRALRGSKKFSEKSDSEILKWIEEQMREKEEVYFTPQEAIELNFADEIFGIDGRYDWDALKS